MMKKLKNIIAGLFLGLALVGCSSNSADNSNIVNSTNTENTTESLRELQISADPASSDYNSNETTAGMLDRNGNLVEIPENVDTIVSLAPSFTETIVNLGLADRLVAVDPYSLDIEGLPSGVQTFDIMTPDVESIVMLNPDVIFGTAMTLIDGSNPFEQMQELGTFVTVIPTPSNIDGILADISFIGNVLRKSEEARSIMDNFLSTIEEIKEEIASYDTKEKLTVYFETSPSPYMYTFGSDVFLSEYLEILNLENIFDERGWLPVSEEQIIERNPDIIFTNVSYEVDPVSDIKNRAGWDTIDAVKNGRVYLIDANSSSRPNEFSVNALISMKDFIY